MWTRDVKQSKNRAKNLIGSENSEMTAFDAGLRGSREIFSDRLSGFELADYLLPCQKNPPIGG